MSKLSQILEQKQKFSPQQVIFTSLLELDLDDLEKKIIKELEENPIIELVEINSNPDDENEDKENDEKDWDEMINSDDDVFKTRSSKDNFDLTLNQKSRNSFIENLLLQINQINFQKNEKLIAETLIWNINDQGYLTTDLDLISDRLNIDIKEIEKILKIVQGLEPIGVGSRNLRECLSIQLKKKSKNSLSKKIISEYFNDFFNKRFKKIKNDINCTSSELNEAINIISSLNPKPGDGDQLNNSNYIIPDILIEEVDGKLIVTTNDGNLPEKKISPLYQEMLLSKESKEVKLKKFLENKIESANWLIQAIQQRQVTIMKVMKSIIKMQPDFFKGKINKINPLILKNIGEDINMDISTVSRVTNGKYVQTPWGVYELKHFFSDKIINNYGEKVSTKNVKLELKQIIANEDKNKPLSDEILSDIMIKKGFPIARRTISKYREQLNIPVARLRTMFLK